MRPRRLPLPVAVAVLAVVIAGCGADSSESSPDPDTTSPVAALCADLAAARAGGLEAVRRGFDHGPLHDIADRVTAVDRSIAADLLKAKEAVESGIADGTPAPELTEEFETLIDATVAATEALGDPDTAGCEETP